METWYQYTHTITIIKFIDGLNCRMVTGSTVESLEGSLALFHPTFWMRRRKMK